MGRRWARFFRKFDRSGGWRFWWFPCAVVGLLLVMLLAWIAYQVGALGWVADVLDWLNRLAH